MELVTDRPVYRAVIDCGHNGAHLCKACNAAHVVITADIAVRKIQVHNLGRALDMAEQTCKAAACVTDVKSADGIAVAVEDAAEGSAVVAGLTDGGEGCGGVFLGGLAPGAVCGKRALVEHDVGSQLEGDVRRGSARIGVCGKCFQLIGIGDCDLVTGLKLNGDSLVAVDRGHGVGVAGGRGRKAECRSKTNHQTQGQKASKNPFFHGDPPSSEKI